MKMPAPDCFQSLKSRFDPSVKTCMVSLDGMMIWGSEISVEFMLNCLVMFVWVVSSFKGLSRKDFRESSSLSRCLACEM